MAVRTIEFGTIVVFGSQSGFVAQGGTATERFMSIVPKDFVVPAEVGEGHYGLLDWSRNVAYDLTPVVEASTDDTNQLLHAAQCHDADLTSPLNVERTVGVLQVLCSGIDEYGPGKVLM